MFSKKKAVHEIQQDELTFADIILPDRIKEYEDYYKIDDLYCRTMVVYTLPEWVAIGWFNEVINLGGVTVSVQMIPYDRREASSKRISRRFAQIGSQIINARRAGNSKVLAALEEKHAYYEYLLTELSMHREILVAVQVVISITAESLKELYNKSLKVKDVLKGTGTRTMYGRQLTGFEHILPHRRIALPEYHDCTMAGAICMAPLITTDFSHPSGIYFGPNASGTPAFLDLFIGNPYLFGPHMFITGTTTSGKSVTTKGIIARSIAEGIKTVILDPEREYLHLIEALGGTYVRLTPQMDVMFNPFDLEAEYDKTTNSYYVDTISKQEDIVNIFSTMLQYQSGERMSSEERALAQEAVRIEYESRGITRDPNSLYQPGGKVTEEGYNAGRTLKEMPTLSSYAERLREIGAKNLANVLLPFLHGGPQGFFDGQSIGTFYDSRLVCFDIYDLTSDFTRTYAMLVLLTWVWEKFIKKQRKDRKRVMIDEAWLFAKYHDTSIFMENMARRGAKHNCSLMLATQSFAEFTETPQGRAIIEQCDTKYFLRMKPIQAKAMSEMFQLPSAVIDQMKTFLPGQGLLMAGDISSIVRFQPFDFEWPFLESNPERRAKLGVVQ